MPSGTRIERLFLSLGLDISEFDRDLAGAQQHVRQAASQLGRDLRLQRLRMEIDLAGVDNVDNSLRGLGIRLGALRGQMQTQRSTVDLLNHAYNESVRLLGANNAASRNLQERLTREQLAEARLAQQIRQTNAARNERVSANVGSGMDNLGMALAPTVAAGAASLKLAVDAVESENLWRESMGKMKTEGDAWSKALRGELGLNEFELRKSTGMLNTMFESMGMGTQKSYDLATGMVQLGYDMASFYNISSEDAFLKLKSGMTGEMEPLKNLGILVDETTVKNYAYANSITKQGEELTAQEKVLARYGTIMDQTKRAQGDMARTLNDPANSIRVLKSNVEQLGIEFGQTLIPALQDFVKQGKETVDWYNNLDTANKTVANSFAKTTIEVGTAASAMMALRMIGIPLNPWVALATAIGIATMGVSDHLKKRQELKQFEESEKLGSTPSADVAKIRTNPYSGYREKEVEFDGLLGKARKWQKVSDDEDAQIDKQVEKIAIMQARRAQIESDLANSGRPINKDIIDEQMKNEFDQQYSDKKWADNFQRDADNDKRQAQIQAQAAAERLKKEKEAADAILKLNEELSADLYKLQHNDLESSIHDIDLKVAELRKGKADEVNIVAWAEAAKNKIMTDASKEIDLAIYNISHTALQNRLHDIDTERQAWIKKTGDEVKATQLAEQEKTKAIKDAITSQYGEEVRAVSAAIKAGTSISDAYREAHAKVLEGQKADSDAYKYVKQQLGVYEPGDIKKTVVIENNSAYTLSETIKELSFNIAKFDPKLANINPNRANSTNNITVNVPVTATLNNDTDVTALANKVADVMQPQLIKALNGGDDNGY